jgi:hypothetical protein
VLTIVAGAALVALAAAIPAGLLGTLVFWTLAISRRRRREQALDLT